MAVAVLALVACASVFVAPELSGTQRAAVSNVVSAPFAAAAALAVVTAAVRSSGRARLAWALLAAGCGCWLVAEAANALATLPVGWRPSVAEDLFSLLSIPFGIAALLVFPGARWRGADRARSLIEGLTVAAALYFVGRGLGLLDWAPEPLGANLVALAYPVGDLIVLTLALSVLIRTAHDRQLPATLRRRDGPDVPVELSIGPLEADGAGAGVVVVFRDVTGRRAVERMKSEFMSVISHELRTPLTSIRGALAMLDGGLGGTLPPAGSRMVTLALQSSERLSRLINDILDVERLESGTLTLSRSSQDAAQLVENAVHEMSGMAMPADVRLRIGPTQGRVDADPDRVVQTLTNLIGNAIKFSPAGGEIVVTAAPQGAPSTGMVEFSVADQGRGIPAHKLESIFDRFEQVDSSDARRHGGTGLGLAICRDIVVLHGGRIWVTSRNGSGADFRFTLPVAVGTRVDRAPGDVDPDLNDAVGAKA